MKNTLNVTSSFLQEVIKKSNSLNTNLEIISAFQRIAALDAEILDTEHAGAADDKDAERKLLFDNVEPKLLPLAEDLYGLTETEEPDVEE